MIDQYVEGCDEKPLVNIRKVIVLFPGYYIPKQSKTFTERRTAVTMGSLTQLSLTPCYVIKTDVCVLHGNKKAPPSVRRAPLRNFYLHGAQYFMTQSYREKRSLQHRPTREI
jgi:hypothetical protein